MTNKATFGAGCFWGIEETFRTTKGVVATAVGYLGGTLDKPTYRDVCSGRTGHAEVVEVEYDPSALSYDALLDIFWKNHNPTTLNRQGPDVGTQYRSAIFYHDAAQRDAAIASKTRLDQLHAFNRPIVTEISPATTFYRAEEYHQQYLAKRGETSCHL
ncbi:MAG: peptide-methionine (S)-S-oxide reductase MsrA [Gemmatimonadaceae bacterium]